MMEQTQSLDFQPFLIALAVFIVLVLGLIILYLTMGQNTMTYEEAKKQQEDKAGLVPEQKKAANKSDKKQKKKKKKENVSGSEKRIQLEVEPQVLGEDIALGEPSSSETEAQPAKAAKKNKSILINIKRKAQGTAEPVPDSLGPEVDVVEEAVIQPKTSLASAAVPNDMKGKAKSTDTAKRQRGSLSWEARPHVMGEDPPPSSSGRRAGILLNKDESPQPAEGSAAATRKQRPEGSTEPALASAVRQAVLSPDEASLLISLLQEKTEDSPELASLSKDDPAYPLQKQLQGRDRIIKSERALRLAAEERRNLLERDLQRVKAKAQQKEADCVTQQQEVRALQERLQHSSQASMAELSQLQARVRQSESRVAPEVAKRLNEENTALKSKLAESAESAVQLQQQLAVMQTSLADSVQRMNKSERERQAAEQRLQQEPRRDESELQATRAQLAKTQQELLAKAKDLEQASKIRAELEKRIKIIEEQLLMEQSRRTEELKQRQMMTQAASESAALQQRVQQLEHELRAQQEVGRRETAQLQHSSSAELQGEGRQAAELQQLQTARDSLEQQLLQAEEQTQRAMSDLQARLDKQTAEMTELSVEREQIAVSEVSALEARLTEAEERADVAEEDLAQSQEALRESEEKGVRLQQETNALQQQISVMESRMKENGQSSAIASGEIQHLQEQLERERCELEQVRATANELREAHWAVTEQLNSAQKDVDVRLAVVTEAARRDEAAAVAAEQQRTRCRLQQAFPTVSLQQEHSDWVAAFRDEVHKQYTSRQEAASAQEELKAAKDQLVSATADAASLRKLLQATEEALTKLESQVSSEIQGYVKKCEAKDKALREAEQKLLAAQKEAKNAPNTDEDDQGVNFAYRCVEKSLENIVSQLEQQLEEASTRLGEVEAQNGELQAQLVSITGERGQLRVQLSAANERLAHLTQAKNDVINGNSETELTEGHASWTKAGPQHLGDEVISDSESEELNEGVASLKGIVDDVLTQEN